MIFNLQCKLLMWSTKESQETTRRKFKSTCQTSVSWKILFTYGPSKWPSSLIAPSIRSSLVSWEYLGGLGFESL